MIYVSAQQTNFRPAASGPFLSRRIGLTPSYVKCIIIFISQNLESMGLMGRF
jgi:hypothetical protein